MSNQQETEEMKTSENEKFHSLIEILKGMEYREITNLLNAVTDYVERKKSFNYLS